jgi:hypothetical protein
MSGPEWTLIFDENETAREGKNGRVYRGVIGRVYRVTIGDEQRDFKTKIEMLRAFPNATQSAEERSRSTRSR